MDGKYIFTEHLIERIKERFPNIELPWNDRYQIYKDLNHMIDNSYDERRYLNDTAYTFYLYKTYGYEARYEFRVNEEFNIVFIVALHHGSRKIVKTCIPLKDGTRFAPNKKYRSNAQHKSTNLSRRKRKFISLNEAKAQQEYSQYNTI